jgi:protein-tyrosine phosphatase
MPEILGWRNAPDGEAMVRRAAQALVEGQLVGFPTETIYGIAAAAWLPEAVERLAATKGRQEQKPMALAIRGPHEVPLWVPNLGKMGWRLARRCMPGPITLVCDVPDDDEFRDRLSASVRRWVCPNGTLGLRSPAHEAIQQVLQLLPGPVLLTSANPSGEAEATDSFRVARTFEDHLALIIDDGPSPLGRASTVVRIQGDSWKVIREGVLHAGDLQALAACLILFVCTGNTCRSPLAEALCKKMLAEKLQCTVPELPGKGFLVQSAGLAAWPGDRATPEAMEMARELGVDIQGHVSRPVTGELAFQSDYLVAMTQTHVQTLRARFSDEAPPPTFLCSDGADLPDPIGCDLTVYRECAQALQKHLEPWVEKFLAGDCAWIPM